MPKMQVLEPRYFDRFKCIGADCEDTCCDGWGVVVDRESYERYQNPRTAPIAGEALSSLVEVNPASSSAGDYARMRLVGTRCRALREGLCSIQQTLGEPYISDTCSSFPRVLNMTGGEIEMSLHLSCPEAARLALTDPDAMVFRERAEDELTYRPGALTSAGDAPDDHLREVREFMIRVIRERSRPLWQRIATLGLGIDDLARVQAMPAVTVLENHLKRLGQGSFDQILSNQAPAPAGQLEAVAELIVARFETEFTSPRFLECYGEFMRGLGWTGDSTMEELAGRYHRAQHSYFLPFVRSHEHLFENYLVNYLFRTLFPYGRKQADTKLAIDSSGESMKSAYLLFAAHYAIILTVLIGMAALHEHNLNLNHALKLVQSCTKAFQHSSSYSTVVLQYLARHMNDPMRDVVALVRD